MTIMQPLERRHFLIRVALGADLGLGHAGLKTISQVSNQVHLGGGGVGMASITLEHFGRRWYLMVQYLIFIRLDRSVGGARRVTHVHQPILRSCVVIAIGKIGIGGQSDQLV